MNSNNNEFRNSTLSIGNNEIGNKTGFSTEVHNLKNSVRDGSQIGGLQITKENIDQLSDDESSFVVKADVESQKSKESNFGFNINVERIAPEKKEIFSEDLESLEKSNDSEDNDQLNLGNVAASGTKFYNKDIIEEYYKFLREEFYRTNVQYEDGQFDENPKYFQADGEYSEENKDTGMTFERIDDLIQDKINFFHYNTTPNLTYEFKIKRGTISDRNLVGSILLLFQKKLEYFTNIVVDYEHIEENLKAGFCGFTFFINGEWINITVDTRLPQANQDDCVLSQATSSKLSFWLQLLIKAYAKVYKSYFNIRKVSIKNTLVDLTGGVSKKLAINPKMDEEEQKKLYEEIKKNLAQGNLIGCTKFVEGIDDELNESNDENDEKSIIENIIYNIIDIQEIEGKVLVYLMNYWNKGKWTGDYGPENEVWETNKHLKTKLKYENINDGSFWMTFQEWYSSFNYMYSCRIFGSNWSQYCISGQWEGSAAGGGLVSFPPNRQQGDQLNLQSFMDPNYKKKTTSFDPLVKKQQTGMLSSMKTGNFNFDDKPSTLNLAGASSIGIINKGSNNQTIALKSSILVHADSQNSSLNPTNKLTRPSQLNSATVGNMNFGGVMAQPSKFQSGSGSQMRQKSGDKLVEKKDVKKGDLVKKETIKRVILEDSEDRWFLNPQYKLEIKYGTSILVTLLQEDENVTGKAYQKCNFVVMISQNKNSRIWDYKEELVVKKAVDYDVEVSPEPCREIQVKVDYWEVIKKIKEVKKRKNIPKNEIFYVNVIPYIDFCSKVEIEKVGINKIFKSFKIESLFWLRIFCTDDLYVSELIRPFEKSIDFNWNNSNSGGARFVKDENSSKIKENPLWPINPQFMINFESSCSLKIVVKKTTGLQSYEDTKIGFMVTKPENNKIEYVYKNLKAAKSTNKNDQIQRIIESTNHILECNKVDFDLIKKKLYYNRNEWVVESSYNNYYVACQMFNLNKIDSPLLVIPTMQNSSESYGSKITVYSNKRFDLLSLDNENSVILTSEWNALNAGGSHISQEDFFKKKRKEEDSEKKKVITWLDNPKFELIFQSTDKIPNVEFEIILSRSETIWSGEIAKSIINTMMGLYIFRRDVNILGVKEDNWLNKSEVEFAPKTEIITRAFFTNVHPEGFILMPTTYSTGVKGPFTLMVNCNEKFILRPLEHKKK